MISTAPTRTAAEGNSSQNQKPNRVAQMRAVNSIGASIEALAETEERGSWRVVPRRWARPWISITPAACQPIGCQ